MTRLHAEMRAAGPDGVAAAALEAVRCSHGGGDAGAGTLVGAAGAASAAGGPAGAAEAARGGPGPDARERICVASGQMLLLWGEMWQMVGAGMVRLSQR